MFVIPGLDSTSCIVKVNVEFKELGFEVKCTCYENLSEGIEAIMSTVREKMREVDDQQSSCIYYNPWVNVDTSLTKDINNFLNQT